MCNVFRRHVVLRIYLSQFLKVINISIIFVSLGETLWSQNVERKVYSMGRYLNETKLEEINVDMTSFVLEGVGYVIYFAKEDIAKDEQMFWNYGQHLSYGRKYVL